MKPCFVHTSNVKRFLAAVNAAKEPGAPEAGLVLIQGDAGYGKTVTGQWWCTQHDAIYIRLKAAITPHWILTELVEQLGGHAPAHTCEKLWGQAIATLTKKPQPIMIDEVEYGLDNLKVLETIRDLGDVCEVRIIFMGREFVRSRLSRHPQFKTRFAARADFQPATLQDVRLLCKHAAEVEIGDDVAERILDDSAGRVREVMKAIKIVEEHALRRKMHAVRAADVVSLQLVDDFTGAAKVAEVA